MTKAHLIESLENLEDDEKIYFIDKNGLQYTICDDVYVNDDGIFIKENYQTGYAEDNVNLFFNR